MIKQQQFLYSALEFETQSLNEKGQATSEYVVMLAVVVSLVIGVFRTWAGPALAKFTDGLTKNIESQFLAADLHYFRVQR
jgi:Ca2+/H+ antiporter